MSSADTIN